MSFMDAKFSKWGEVETAVLSQSLAKRFARVMLAAVLAASFLPVAAFADGGGAVSDPVGNAFKGPDKIQYGVAAQYTNITSRSEYKWDYIRDNDGGDVTISYLDNLYPNHKTVSVMGTQVGHVTLVVSGGDVDEERFEIEITKRNVTLKSTNVSKTYDGEPLACPVSVDPGFATFDDVYCIPTSSRTNVGITNNNTFEIIFIKGSPDSYNITKFETGIVEITPRPVTLTSASGSKEYDGKPLTNHKVTVGEAARDTGWVDGQGATYSFTGSQKIVGSSENAFECIPNEGTNLDNYQINKTYGTLTVTDRSEKHQITLTPNSKSVTYDGTEKSASGFETLEFQINGQTFYVSGVEASATGTDAGEYPVKVSGQAVVIDSDGNDVTDQFTVNIDDAKLTIVGVDSDKSASNLPHTGDSAALYAMGICGVAIAAGAGALFMFRKRNNYK